MGDSLFEGGEFAAINLSVLEIEVLDFELLAPPGSPSAGDAYTVGRGATGPWYLWDDDVATYIGSGVWGRSHPVVGSRARKIGTSQWRTFGQGGWADSSRLGVGKSSLTAATTQAQGQAQLAHEFNHVGTVANTGDAVTLPAARAGVTCSVFNDGANALAVFPSLGDTIDTGSANTSKALAAGKRAIFLCATAGAWSSLVGA